MQQPSPATRTIRTVIVDARYRWHEIGLCVSLVVFAVLHFAFPSPPISPPFQVWSFHIWYALGGVGGLISLLGIFGPRDDHVESFVVALKREQSGLLFIAASGVVFMSTTFKHVPRASVAGVIMVQVLILTVWVGASLIRALQIRKELRQIQGRA